MEDKLIGVSTHTIEQVKEAVKSGADYIGVAVLEEGMLLRASGVTISILVMGGVLGNQVDISFAVIKDAVSGAYNTIMLGAAIFFAYKIQDWGKPKQVKPGEEKESVYGRPLVKGD